MSTVSLPSYFPPLLNRTPSYSAEPHHDEQRIASGNPLLSRILRAFVKQSRGRNTLLRLSAQENNTSLPVYNSGSLVEGTVELTKTEGVTSVEVKASGIFDLHTHEVSNENLLD